MVEEMIQAINARSEAEWPARAQARMAMAEAAHRQQVRQNTLSDLVTVLTLNAGFLGIIIFMALATV